MCNRLCSGSLKRLVGYRDLKVGMSDGRLATRAAHTQVSRFLGSGFKSTRDSSSACFATLFLCEVKQLFGNN